MWRLRCACGCERIWSGSLRSGRGRVFGTGLGGVVERDSGGDVEAAELGGMGSVGRGLGWG